MKLTLNIGKLDDGTLMLVLADADTTDVYPLAKFINEDCATVFQEWMGTQGYTSVPLPTNEQINELLGDAD